MIDERDVMPGEDSTAEFFEHLTRSGSKLFREDEQVVCGLIFEGDSGQPLLCSASPIVHEMYQVLSTEHAVGEGPAAHALSASKVLVAQDISDPEHSSLFSVPAAMGFRSILSIPLTIGPEGRAVLNFYAPSVAFFSSDRQRVASVFAEQAAVSVELRLRLARCQDLAMNMRSAMESRTSIDMAIGIIVAQNRCTQAEASVILKRASNTRNVKVRELAENMVAQASGSAPTTHFT